jgi:hypothetical protein
MMTKREKLLGCAFTGAVSLVGMAVFGPWNPSDKTGAGADPALPGKPERQVHPGNHRSATQRKEPIRTLASGEEAKEWARASNAERIAELRAGGVSAARKQELLSLIVGSAGADPGEVMAFIEELPEGERSEWFAELAGSCAAQAPDLFFAILGKLPPGSNRLKAARDGVLNLDPQNLTKLVEFIHVGGDKEEIEDLAQSFRFLENDKLKSADLVSMMGGVKGAELRNSIAYGAGKLDAVAGTPQNLDAIRSSLGSEGASEYFEGLLTKMGETNPEALPQLLTNAPMGKEARYRVLNNLVAQMLPRGGIQAAALGKGFSGADSDTYYSELGRILMMRDSMEASLAADQAPEGKPRDLMAAEVVKYLYSKGLGESLEAKQWKESIQTASVLKGLESLPQRR